MQPYTIPESDRDLWDCGVNQTLNGPVAEQRRCANCWSAIRGTDDFCCPACKRAFRGWFRKHLPTVRLPGRKVRRTSRAPDTHHRVSEW
jgi:predicted amidophosphoribosyltransferase